MMTVWVVTEHGYDYGVVVGVFETKAQADEALRQGAELIGGNVEAEEWEVQATPVDGA